MISGGRTTGHVAAGACAAADTSESDRRAHRKRVTLPLPTHLKESMTRDDAAALWQVIAEAASIKRDHGLGRTRFVERSQINAGSFCRNLPGSMDSTTDSRDARLASRRQPTPRAHSARVKPTPAAGFSEDLMIPATRVPCPANTAAIQEIRALCPENPTSANRRGLIGVISEAASGARVNWGRRVHSDPQRSVRATWRAALPPGRTQLPRLSNESAGAALLP